MDPLPEMAHLWNVAAAVLVGWLVLKGYRSIRRHSRLLGRIVAAGILARAAVGLALFWISYLQLPVATSFHTGDGFWQLATDARGYYHLATYGESETIRDVESVPSPVFVRTLALWMSLVGISPASGLFLNLSLYVVLMVMLVWYYKPVDDWRRDLPCIVGVAAYSFSPALVLHSTQALKDNLACTLIGVACLGVLGIGGFIYRDSERATDRAFASGVFLLSVATFGMAGIRWYYAALMLGAVATVLGVFALRRRSTPWRPYARGCAVVSAAMCIAFLAGAGPTYRDAMLESVIGGPRYIAFMIARARTGFISSGGATNIGSMVPTDSEDSGLATRSEKHSGPATRSEEHSRLPTHSEEQSRPRVSNVLAHQAIGLSLGTAFLLLPTSFIATTSGFVLQGGQGLLPFVDLDTIFQDVAIVWILALLWTRRRDIGTGLPLVVFGLVLSVASATLMAYIVTNVGTMVRLRLLVMVPLWLLGLAVTARRSPTAPPAVDRGSRPRAPGANYDSRVVGAFGEEWNRFDQSALPQNEAQLLFDRYFAIFPWTALPANAIGFDAGCGSGRWARLVAPRVGALHCVDASKTALGVAAKNLSSYGNCTVHLATIDDIPLPDDSMDFGYSLGVLHHIPDTASSLRACVRKLKPGAPFLVYLYYRFDNRPAWFRMIWRASSAPRVILSRVPFRARALACDVLAATVYWPLARFAALAEQFGARVDNLPLSSYRALSFYVMRTDALDRFGTRLEKRFTRQEIRELMEGAGLSNVDFHDGEPYWVALGYRSTLT